MKPSFLITGVLIFITSLISFADTSKTRESYKDIKEAALKWKRSTPGRPNAPSKIFIECQYGEGWINFSFPDISNVLYVEISNDSETWTGVATLYEPTIETPCFEGLYTIQCTTDDNRIFIGELHY